MWHVLFYLQRLSDFTSSNGWCTRSAFKKCSTVSNHSISSCITWQFCWVSFLKMLLLVSFCMCAHSGSQLLVFHSFTFRCFLASFSLSSKQSLTWSLALVLCGVIDIIIAVDVVLLNFVMTVTVALRIVFVDLQTPVCPSLRSTLSGILHPRIMTLNKRMVSLSRNVWSLPNGVENPWGLTAKSQMFVSTKCWVPLQLMGCSLVSQRTLCGFWGLRTRVDSWFASTLMRTLRKNTSVDLTKILESLMPNGTDMTDWNNKTKSIQILIDQLVPTIEKLMPADPTKELLAKVEQLEKENAALQQQAGSGQSATSGSRKGQCKRPQPVTCESQITKGWSTSKYRIWSVRRGDHLSVLSIHSPENGTTAKVSVWIMKFVPKKEQTHTEQMIKEITEQYNALVVVDRPNLEPILSDGGLSATCLAKMSVKDQAC